MSYHDLLYMYGSEQESAETRIYIFAQQPRKLKTTDEVIYRDNNAAGDIKRLEKLIADLKDYRRALAERYGELATLPYKIILKLERCPHWKGHIEYIITIEKTLSDGTTTNELREVFPGKDRRKAFSRFDELQKQRPGIETIKEIDKRPWEK